MSILYIGMGLVLLVLGVLCAMFLQTTLGIILIAIGALAIILSFMQVGPFHRREVIVERERPVAREREVVREREL